MVINRNVQFAKIWLACCSIQKFLLIPSFEKQTGQIVCQDLMLWHFSRSGGGSGISWVYEIIHYFGKKWVCVPKKKNSALEPGFFTWCFRKLVAVQNILHCCPVLVDDKNRIWRTSLWKTTKLTYQIELDAFNVQFRLSIKLPSDN